MSNAPHHDPATDGHASYRHHPVEDIEPRHDPDGRGLEPWERLSLLLVWMLGGGYQHREHAMRLWVACSILKPAIMPLDFAAIAKQFGVTRQAVDKVASDFRGAFGLDAAHVSTTLRPRENRQTCRSQRYEKTR